MDTCPKKPLLDLLSQVVKHYFIYQQICPMSRMRNMFLIKPFWSWEIPTSHLATCLYNQSSYGKSTYCYCGKNNQGQQETWTRTGNVWSLCHSLAWWRAKLHLKKRKKEPSFPGYYYHQRTFLVLHGTYQLPFWLERSRARGRSRSQVLAREGRGC